MFRGETSRDRTCRSQREAKVEVAGGKAKDAVGAKGARRARSQVGSRSNLEELWPD